MASKRRPIQQGDVFFEPADKVPSKANKVKPDSRGHVFAEGEVTGHYHGTTVSDGATMFEKDGVLYFSSDSEFTVKHQEHNPITVSPGVWKIKIVQEWDHLKEEADRVRD